MIRLILQLAYLMLPAYFANIAPVIVKKVPVLAIPIDTVFHGKTIFGKNKTFRGLAFSILFGIATAYIQYNLTNMNIGITLNILNYENWFLLGFLMGLGALIGDLIASFFKRRLGYKPGQPFIPLDQTDFACGALLLSYPLTNLTLPQIGIILLLSFIIHIGANHFAYYTGILDKKW